ncbi:PREDICTED: cyclin-D5-1-like [Lupinus angustifolius]|uniref:cyclin-D5-1-like n=1 Tax=Lupinus angustifolius TaxID=3871 RepID=UPI00092F470D|nr:PREDICTED: cyclin-D5-1-like isoform X2 [Lupinus angustifolius]XP_019429842.1 PREDICTED: cyclin-D5-1-like [Lupinus angustifolius]
MDDSISTLLCQENVTFLEGELGNEKFPFIPLSDYGVLSEDEYIAILIEREIRFGLKKNESFVFENWIECARADAINWIFKTRAALGFYFQTAYLSVAYFDRFLSKRSIDNGKYWAIRLLSVACLSLAAKMEECNVPFLLDYQSEDYCFENKVIQRMELLVLTTLQWNMANVTPFAFLPYFITKLCNETPPFNVLSRAMQLIFTLMKEVNLMDHRPSVIAAAATLVAVNQQLTIEAVKLKMSSIHQHRFLDPKDIFACYNQIQSLYLEKTRRGKLVDSSGPSSPIQSMTKRRRLAINDGKESCDGKKLP